MAPVTQAIQSSLINSQTSAECCLELAHMGYRMFQRLVWVRARLGTTSANTQSLSSLSPSPSSIVLLHSGLSDRLSSDPPLSTSSHAAARSSSQSEISSNPSSWHTSRAALSSRTCGNAADAPCWADLSACSFPRTPACDGTHCTGTDSPSSCQLLQSLSTGLDAPVVPSIPPTRVAPTLHLPPATLQTLFLNQSRHAAAHVLFSTAIKTLYTSARPMDCFSPGGMGIYL